MNKDVVLNPTVEFISGCMKSGKSKLLMDRIHEHEGEYLILKPSTDTRDGDRVKSRAYENICYKAVVVDEDNQQTVVLVFNGLHHYKTVFIDEVQFFSKGFIEDLLEDCYQLGVNVVASGLSFDYLGRWFESSEYLLKYIVEVNDYSYLRHKCYTCSKEAGIDVLINKETNRLVTKGEQVVVDGSQEYLQYETLCESCYTWWKRVSE